MQKRYKLAMATAGMGFIILSVVVIAATDIKWIPSLSMTIGICLMLLSTFWQPSPKGEESSTPISDKRKIAAVLICLISIAAAVVALIPSVAKNVKAILAIAYFAILTALFICLGVRKRRGRLS